MEKQMLVQVTQQALPKERRDFLFPPYLEIEVADVDRSFPGGLIGRKILVNPQFITEMAQRRGISPQTIVRAVIDRAFNRWLRVPQSFAQTLRLYAALREVVQHEQTARKHLDIYFALWNEIDLFENRGKGDDLVALYRASLAIPKEEQKKLPIHYLILVGVLQQRLCIDLGLDRSLLWGWQALAEELAKIDYLHSIDRKRDIQRFGDLYGRVCYHIETKVIGEQQEQRPDEPVHWPLENALDTFLSAQDISEGIDIFLDEFPDKEKALKLLAEFSALSPEVRQLLGQTLLLEQSRWWWYAHLAQQYRLGIEKKLSQQTGRVYPVSLKRWLPEDGVFHLAPLATFGPVGLPGITKRWLHSGPESRLYERQVPDLIIVIDSSGSMPDPNTDKSFAVLGGIVAADSYMDYGSKVAVINFSDQDLELEFSRDRTQVYKYIAAAQWGGTMLHPETIDKLLQKSQGEVDVLIITDLGLGDFDATIAKIAEQAKTRRIFFFLINASDETAQQTRQMMPESVEFFSVQNDEGLLKIVLGAVQRSFEGQAKTERKDYNDASN